MKDDDAVVIPIPSSSSATSATTATTISSKKETADAVVLGRTGYKLWVLAAIILLAFWSMFTGSVTLKFSSGNLTHLSDDLDFPIHDDDLDVLEVEEKEKLVKHMWDIYTHSTSTRLPRFWQEAFEAAYESLVSDISAVRDAAVSEIAKMSLRSFNLDPLLVQSGPNFSQGDKGQMLANKSKRSSQ